MNTLSRTFRDEILRAVLGPDAHKVKPANAARVNQLAEIMAGGAQAKAILCAKGYGSADLPLATIAGNVPADAFCSPRRARDA